MAEFWTPPLQIQETAGRCRLILGAWAHGDGHTLQEAADDLVGRLLLQARHLRSGGVAVPTELGPPDHRRLDFLWQVAERAGRGEDIRAVVLG